MECKYCGGEVVGGKIGMFVSEEECVFCSVSCCRLYSIIDKYNKGMDLWRSGYGKEKRDKH